ncbi:trichome birefringence-like 36 protein [Nymphaea thermarum]|nr:trichome birefringence-like 36 protein [Nymphaea thermarum]
MGDIPAPCFSSIFLLLLLCFSFITLRSSHGESLQLSHSLLAGSWLDEEEEEAKEGDANVVMNSQNYRQRCDLSIGKWVYDPSYPLYYPSCNYLSSKVNCWRNGRPDSDYQRWKWTPSSCSIPRFNSLDFLGRMRRKRIMLVGDSIMRSQWESLVCMVEAVLPKRRKTLTFHGPSMAFHALDFEASIEFFWAPFLVELKVGPGNRRILHLDSIEENARYWRAVDILVFDSAHWWIHTGKWKSWDVMMEGNKAYTSMNPMVAYQKGLSTWARWVDLNLNPERNRVIFRSFSPLHNGRDGGKCYHQQKPLQQFQPRHRLPVELLVQQQVMKTMRFPVYLQEISTMSALRRDGHPSLYTHLLSEEERQHVNLHGLDCSHWCLPGVPDIWNEMLYAYLLG